MDIFLYICNMENEELDFSDWIEVDWNSDVISNVFGIGDPVRAYNKIQSVRILGEMGIHVTYYNRDKIVHPYGK